MQRSSKTRVRTIRRWISRQRVSGKASSPLANWGGGRVMTADMRASRDQMRRQGRAIVASRERFDQCYRYLTVRREIREQQDDPLLAAGSQGSPAGETTIDAKSG